MADNFEKAKDAILKRTAGNGGPKPLDLLDALQGLADDTDETAVKLAIKVEAQHKESLDAIAEMKGLLETHCEEADVRDQRITAIEAWKVDSETHCAERIKRIIHDEHSVVHAAHLAAEHVQEAPRRSDDAKGSDHVHERDDSIAAVVGPIEKKMWVLWAIFIFFVVEAGHAVTMWLIERAAGS